MGAYHIFGGKRLFGEVTVSGSKNAALPILFASLLFSEPVTLLGVPHISDTEAALSLLCECGVTEEKKEGVLLLGTEHLAFPENTDAATRLRAGIYLLPVLLSRFGRASLPLPGGCDFGSRPIDYHLSALSKMGTDITVCDGKVYAEAKRLRGADIVLPKRSVGATVSVILAAVNAEGTTRLFGAAEEPHIQNLIGFLRSGGAKIYGDGTPNLVIEGVKTFSASRHRIIGDMIEGGTYLLMGALTGGSVTVKGVAEEELFSLAPLFSEMGIRLEKRDGGITAVSPARLSAADAVTAPYPLLPTDLQPLVGACLSVADGIGSITETVWQDRFRYTEGLKTLGARITVSGNKAVFYGVKSLYGANTVAPDLRGGAALVAASLAAKGESRVSNRELIERGYAAFPEKLRSLGAKIEEV